MGYPMAGFDIMWAHACFPNAKRYVMLGQNPAIPQKKSMKNKKLLKAAVRALKGFTRYKYLTTFDQRKSKADAMRFFVVVLKVLYGAKVKVALCNKQRSTKCISLLFQKPGSKKPQEIRYWGGNVLKHAKNSFYKSFYNDMKGSRFATFFKAAEYDLFSSKCKGGKAAKGYMF